jgi:hypothetical protein
MSAYLQENGHANESSADGQSASDFVTKTQLRDEYELTDKLIGLIGEPDRTRTNPHYKSAAPVQLFDRKRVETFIVQHPVEIERARKRRQAADKAVATKTIQGHKLVEESARQLVMKPIPKRSDLVEEIAIFQIDRYGSTGGGINERAICSHIRHSYTNYERLLESFKGKVGALKLYEPFKVYLCCRIIEQYGLSASPVVAAFGKEQSRFEDDAEDFDDDTNEDCKTIFDRNAKREVVQAGSERLLGLSHGEDTGIERP